MAGRAKFGKLEVDDHHSSRYKSCCGNVQRYFHIFTISKESMHLRCHEDIDLLRYREKYGDIGLIGKELCFRNTLSYMGIMEIIPDNNIVMRSSDSTGELAQLEP